jgi:hypothetical protein
MNRNPATFGLVNRQTEQMRTAMKMKGNYRKASIFFNDLSVSAC